MTCVRRSAVLSRLTRAGETTASALAAAERVRPQSMAVTLRVLDQRGLLRRRPDPDDGRRLVLSLSPAGRDLMDDSRRAREEWLARTLQDELSEAERTALLAAVALLDRIASPWTHEPPWWWSTCSVACPACRPSRTPPARCWRARSGWPTASEPLATSWCWSG